MQRKEKEVTIITAFFDIGRENFGEFARTNNQYLEYFKFWARIKNNVIVYTDKKTAEEVKKIREEFGLLHKTEIIIIDNVYKIDSEIYKNMQKIEKNTTFLNYRYMDNPADNNAKYNYIMFLKSWFIKDAVEKGLAKGLIAWLDFGYNHGGKTYPNSEEFNFLWKSKVPADKVTVFSIKKDDLKPIFQIVQSYAVYIMGAPYFVPDHLARKHWENIKQSLLALLKVGFMDDDQTLLLMATRLEPDMYNVVVSDWFMPLKENGGEHLTVKNKETKKENFIDKCIYKLRVMKRNLKCLKRLQKIFFKSDLD